MPVLDPYTPPALQFGITPGFFGKLIAEIEALIVKYGPLAAPYIDILIAASGLPAWLIPVVESIVNSLLGYTPVPPPVALAK